MSVEIRVTGRAATAASAVLPGLVEDLTASGVAAADPSLWPDSPDSDGRMRLGWLDAVTRSRPLVGQIDPLREVLRADGVTRIVLAGIGGAALAAEVIATTNGLPLVVLDSTAPRQVLSALDGDSESGGLAQTALVVCSPEGSVETAAFLGVFETAYRDIGMDPATRIVVVTDPGSPLEVQATRAGYTLFASDPTASGAYAALTAATLVPAGLAGADVGEILAEAEAALLDAAIDDPRNPALVLAAALTGALPDADKVGLIADGTHLVGFEIWVEHLIAQSTARAAGGILPVVLLPVSPEATAPPEDLQRVRFVADVEDGRLFEPHHGEVLVSGSLGAQFLVWQTAVAIAARTLGTNPFDRPEPTPAHASWPPASLPEAPAFVSRGVEVRVSDPDLAVSETVAGAFDALWSRLEPGGYCAIGAFADRGRRAPLEGLRDLVAAVSGRPTTFGWGPRYLTAAGRLHTAARPAGVFVIILDADEVDVEIPQAQRTFAGMLQDQAAAQVEALIRSGRPVVVLTLTDDDQDLTGLFEAAQ